MEYLQKSQKEKNMNPKKMRNSHKQHSNIFSF